MAGDGFTIDSTQVQQTGYFKQVGGVKPLTPEQKQQFIDLLKRYHFPEQKDDGYKIVVDKNGNPRTGKVVKYQPQGLLDMLQGKKPKELPKVKKAQVNKFLNDIKALGLDLKPEDIMTKDGTLNPNFKVDEKGNISFKNIKDFINNKAPEYFETKDGEWAQAQKFELPEWYAKLPEEDKVIKKLPYQPITIKDPGFALKPDTDNIDPGFTIKPRIPVNDPGFKLDPKSLIDIHWINPKDDNDVSLKLANS